MKRGSLCTPVSPLDSVVAGSEKKTSIFSVRTPLNLSQLVCVVGYYGDRLLDVAVGADDGGSGPGCR